ncbi:MAG: helix-turn-helix domain-containing protein [Desulfovibrio sp.]|jgi:transcriptional regulator with XRE-family HTH domain|nr:helix-turn-helix domain-containing protein [Desulfovibrio sp.]
MPRENRAYSLAETFPDSHPGKALAGLRAREGLTQKQMTEALGISQSRLSELERGVRRISIDMAKKAAEKYGISYRSLL